MMLLPLAICGVCIVTSIVGTFFVRLGKSNNIMGALYQGLIVTGVLSVGAVWWVVNALVTGPVTVGDKTFGANELFFCGVAGLVVTALIVIITEYYTGTGFRPVKSVAKASVSGHGTNVIQGLAMSLESTAAPAIVIIAGIIVTYGLAGLFGIAIATTAMLSLAGFIVASTPSARSPTTPAASPRWRAFRRGPRHHRRPGRRGQHDQGGDQGLCDRLGRPRRPGALRRLH